MPPEAQPVSAELTDAAVRLVALLNDWDDAAADALFTDNVAWDDSYDRRRSAAAALAPLTLDRIDPINAARGRLVCRSGAGDAVTVTIALGVALPMRIQDYEIAT